MSYARFGWEDSEVYVYGSMDSFEGPNNITCSGCLMDPEYESVIFHAKREILDHLQRHRELYQLVPESTIRAIEEDDWIS